MSNFLHSRFGAGSLLRALALLAISVGLLGSCRTIDDDEVTGADTYQATHPDIGAAHKHPQSARWRIAADTGRAGLYRSGNKVVAWVDLEAAPRDTVWIEYWRAGVREQSSAFLFRGTARLEWSGIDLRDTLAIEMLRRIHPSADAARLDTTLAMALVANDSIVRGCGFPGRHPDGIDTARILRIAMLLLVRRELPLARLVPKEPWALGIDTLSVHLRVRDLCVAGLVTDTSKIFPHPIDTTRIDTTKTDTATKPPVRVDTLGPEIRIVAPQAGSWLENFQDTLEVRVRAIDSSRVDSVRVNQRRAVRRDSLWVLPGLFVPVTTSKGFDLVVEAWDSLGNRTQSIIQVGRKAPPPPKEPYHAVLSPAKLDTLPFDSTSVQVRWRVYDPSAALEVVRIGGLDASYEKDSIWNARVPMGAPGTPLRILLAARTSKGTVIADTVIVVRAKDLRGPSIRFSSPADRQVFEYMTDSVQVVVAVTDPSGVAAAKIDGVVVLLTGGTGQRRLPLALGKTTVIQVEATDSAGNRATASIQAIRQPPPDTLAPEIQLVWPSQKSGAVVPFDSAMVTLRWRVKDLIGLRDSSVKIEGATVKVVRDTVAWRVALPPTGTPQVVHLQAVNIKGVSNEVAVSLARESDTVRPSLRRVAAARTVHFDSAVVPVSWEVSDNHKLESVRINNVVVPGNGGLFARSVSLLTGRNTFVLVAMDSTGNLATDSVVIARIWKDTSVPILVRGKGTASQGIDFDSENIGVSWTVSDSSPVRVRINDSLIEGVGGVYSLTAQLVGTITRIVIVAVDTAGNRASDTVTITKASDLQKPTLERTAETRDQTVEYQTRSIRAAWSVSDNGTLGKVFLGESILEVPTDSAYAVIAPLEVGVNVIRIRAVDQAGNFAIDSVVVVRRDLDTTGPQVVRADAGTQDRVVSLATTQVSVSWKVFDARLAQVRINGSVVAGVSGTFSRVVALEPGPNSIVLEALDSAGNRSVDSVVIERTDATLPTHIQSRGGISDSEEPRWSSPAVIPSEPKRVPVARLVATSAMLPRGKV